MPVNKDQFRHALGHLAGAVSVVTAKGADGKLYGITVTAFSSLSLEPPLVLICIDQRASLHQHLRLGGHFAVNMLGEHQESVSRLFAARDADRFNEIGFTEGITGSPLLSGSLAFVECSIVNAYAGGDHTIFVGEVTAANAIEGKPLLYYRGKYAMLS